MHHALKMADSYNNGAEKKYERQLQDPGSEQLLMAQLSGLCTSLGMNDKWKKTFDKDGIRTRAGRAQPDLSRSP